MIKSLFVGFFFNCTKDDVFVYARTKDLIENIRSLHWELVLLRRHPVKHMYGRAMILLSPEKEKYILDKLEAFLM